MKTNCKLENCRGCAYEVEKYSSFSWNKFFERLGWAFLLLIALYVVGHIIVAFNKPIEVKPQNSNIGLTYEQYEEMVETENGFVK